MAGKPKPTFWIFVFLIALTLTAFALHRAGFWTDDDLHMTGEEKATKSAFRGGKLRITFYSSSAKRNWVNEMVTKFNASGTKAGGKIIAVKQFHVTSGGSFDQIKEGKIKPDLWSPGDESWLRMAKAYFRDVKQMDLFDEYTPLVNIPLVIAMWEPMAKVLGYPKPI